MPKLSELLAEKVKAEIEIGGSKLSIEFYVLWRERFSQERTDDDGTVTPGEWDQLMALTGREHYKMLLPRVMLSWDLVDSDGHAVPVTAEAIEQHGIPDTLLFAVGARIAASDLTGKVLLRTSNSSLGS